MVEPIKTVVLADTGDLFLRSMTEAINSESDLRVVGSTGDGPQLLELTGQPVTRYWALLEKVSQVCLSNTELHFV